MKKNKEANIVLIGMPAAGKSTIGVLLAKRIGFSFIDTDVVIQAEEGRKLSEIIADVGVQEFCNVEERHVCGVSCLSHVIATGGSVVYSKKAMKHLCENGIIVHLDIKLERLKQRLEDLDDRGVARGPGQTIETLYSERQPLYEKYKDIAVACDDLTPDQITGELEKKINLFLQE